MKPLIMLTIAGVVMSTWCLAGHADRLYTWQDDKGVTHISKDPPPQNTNLIDIMDYTATPASKNQATGKQISKESESSQPRRIGAQERRKASGTTGSTEDVDEDVYYDGDRYRRKKIRHAERAARREQGENGQENDQRLGDRKDRKENRKGKRDARQEVRENRQESDRSIRKPHRRK